MAAPLAAGPVGTRARASPCASGRGCNPKARGHRAAGARPGVCLPALTGRSRVPAHAQLDGANAESRPVFAPSTSRNRRCSLSAGQRDFSAACPPEYRRVGSTFRPRDLRQAGSSVRSSPRRISRQCRDAAVAVGGEGSRQGGGVDDDGVGRRTLAPRGTPSSAPLWNSAYEARSATSEALSAASSRAPRCPRAARSPPAPRARARSRSLAEAQALLNGALLQLLVVVLGPRRLEVRPVLLRRAQHAGQNAGHLFVARRSRPVGLPHRLSHEQMRRGGGAPLVQRPYRPCFCGVRSAASAISASRKGRSRRAGALNHGR